MPSNLPEIRLPAALESARAVALSHGLPYSGRISPPAANGWRARGLPWVQD